MTQPEERHRGRPRACSECDYSSGTRVRCPNCRAEAAARARRYYETHKAEAVERQRRYRETHKAEVAAWARRYRETHKAAGIAACPRCRQRAVRDDGRYRWCSACGHELEVAS